jgi:adenylate cyclase
MRRRNQALAYWSVAVVAFVTMATLSLIDFPLRTKLQNILFDEYQRWRPRVDAVDLPVRIVDIDDESIRRLGRWPWPRARIAELLRNIEAIHPAAIALDLLFSEPERADDQSGDDALAAAIANGPVVLGDIVTNALRAEAVSNVAGFAVAGDEPAQFVPQFRGLLQPLPGLRKGASGIGFMNWLPDYDRIVRRIPLVVGIGDTLHPSLAMEALRVAQGASTFLVKASNASGESGFGEKTGVVSIKNGDAVIETDPRGALRIDYAADESRQNLPAWKVLQAGQDLTDLAEKIVVLGVSASLLSDIVATPLRVDEPGVNAHAQVIQQVLGGTILVRPDWAPGAEWLVGLVISLGLMFAMPRVSVWLCALFGLFAVSVFAIVSLWAFDNMGLLLDPIMPTLSSIVVLFAGIVTLYGMKSREEKEMRSAFGRYVAPAIVAKLAQNPDHLKLGGEERDLTVMFCDLRSFTTLSEGMSAVELRQFLNDYLTPMTDAVLEASGTVDKYMGDAIMAFWNAPLDDPDHARNAVEASLKMRLLLAGLNEGWRRDGLSKGGRPTEVKFGVGLNTGMCAVGNLGSTRRFDYSAIGDEVNVASRLEGSSKQFGVDIVASESTRALAPDYAWLEVDKVLLKNKTRPVGVFTLAGGAEVARSPAFQSLERAHLQMLDAYRRKAFVEAEEAASAALALAPSEICGLYDYYIARLRALGRSELPAEWRPLVKLEEK